MTPKLKKAAFFACNCVISSHRIMCNASIERSHRGLHFFSLPRQAVFSSMHAHFKCTIPYQR